MKAQILSIFFAFLAAMFYALNAPFSKLLLSEAPPTFMASFLYLGAGLGIGALYAFRFGREEKSRRLSKSDMPYVVAMILLDIAAPIFLMLGLKNGEASSASLLGNFEIVATTLIAFFVFKEKISTKLFAAIILIVISSAMLSIGNFENLSALKFSKGSLFVILATICWGLENNCTRRISNKSAYQIVTLKGLFSGAGSFVIALIAGETLPEFRVVILACALGFVSYGMSIFLYVKAQSVLGAAKTSAYYAVAPFIGVLLSVIFVGEKLSATFFAALFVMILGTIFVISDTIKISGRKKQC